MTPCREIRKATLRQINAAVDVDRLTGDVTPAGRAQEAHSCGDVLDLTVVAEKRMATAWNGAALAGSGGAWSGDAAGRNAIHRDACRAELDRQRPSEPDDARFCC